MTHLRWQKLFCGQSRDSRRKSVRLTLELLEHRLTPAVFNAVDADMLIADIHTANNNQQANTINLTGFYLLYGPENPTNGANALPEITSPFPLTINGNPAVIEGNGLSAFRFFDVASGAALSLNNVALIGGRAEGAGERCFAIGRESSNAAHRHRGHWTRRATGRPAGSARSA